MTQPVWPPSLNSEEDEDLAPTFGGVASPDESGGISVLGADTGGEQWDTTRPSPARASQADDFEPYPFAGDFPQTSDVGATDSELRTAPHTGKDYAFPTGTPVPSAYKGTVTYAGPLDEYGNTVVVEHPDRGTQTQYSHLGRLDVQVGDEVEAGDVVGASGNTGVSEGPHLHYQEDATGTTPAPPTEEGTGQIVIAPKANRKVPTLNDALNDAAVRVAGVSYDAMSPAERAMFKDYYALLDSAAVGQFKKAYRYLSAAQRDQIEAGLSATGLSPAILSGMINQLSQQYRARQINADQYRAELLRAGLNSRLVDRFMQMQAIQKANGPDQKLISATESNMALQYRLGNVTADDFQAALVKAGVSKEVAEQVVGRAVAQKQLSDAAQAATVMRQQRKAMDQAFSRQPKPLAAPKAVPAPEQGLTWAKAALLIPQGDLADLTDAWANGGDGVSAISPEHWRDIMWNIPITSSVPALAQHLQSLFLTQGGSRRAPGGQRAPNFRPLGGWSQVFPPSYFRHPRYRPVGAGGFGARRP